MVHLYAADISNLPDPKENPEVLENLTDERKKNTMRFVQAADRKRSLGAGILLGKILPLYGASPEEIRIGADGKPEVEGICFNLSHSAEFVICAVGEQAVGCDVEKIAKAPERVAEHFFHRHEAEYLRACGEEGRAAMFFRLWTMKESYIKMTGEGMRLPLDSFEFLLDAEKVSVWRDGQMLSCHIMEYEIPGYKVSVCAKEDEFAQYVEYIELGQLLRI
ncbi:MAG: 4'-phosphopantetheinyl transferase superfamily protein [Roseburia sp.]|nr:4'-phosphopantetheinyl transferase superfamily protein [Roseburia sp.]